MSRLPNWLRKKAGEPGATHAMKAKLRKMGIATVCEEAHCPNMGECFERGQATFMIMGSVCTRHCGFCAVKGGTPNPLDDGEPLRVARQIKDMGLKHAVITSVTRDDLLDGGAGHFARVIGEVRRLNPKTTVEVLTPDFNGSERFVKMVCDARPDVFNHNMETVERLTPVVRNKAGYRRSLSVLANARRQLKGGLTKSGLMLGLGEEMREVMCTLDDMRKAGVDVVTVGQYLRPSRSALPVVKYIEPQVFLELKEEGEKMGFKAGLAGPFVRSSYRAEMITETLPLKHGRRNNK